MAWFTSLLRHSNVQFQRHPDTNELRLVRPAMNRSDHSDEPRSESKRSKTTTEPSSVPSRSDLAHPYTHYLPNVDMQKIINIDKDISSVERNIEDVRGSIFDMKQKLGRIPEQGGVFHFMNMTSEQNDKASLCIYEHKSRILDEEQKIVHMMQEIISLKRKRLHEEVTNSAFKDRHNDGRLSSRPDSLLLPQNEILLENKKNAWKTNLMAMPGSYPSDDDSDDLSDEESESASSKESAFDFSRTNYCPPMVDSCSDSD